MSTFNGIGRLGKNPEMKYTPKGTAITKFSMAVTTGYGDKKKTIWVNVSSFGQQAEFVNQWLQKGSLVFVTAEITDVYAYTKKDETPGASLEVKLLTVEFIEGVNKPNETEEESVEEF